MRYTMKVKRTPLHSAFRSAIAAVFSVVFCLNVQGQDGISGSDADFVTLTSPGAGQLVLTQEAMTATNLRVTGPIDARDFKTLKQVTINRTRVLDLSEATIEAYTGYNGSAVSAQGGWIVGVQHEVFYPAHTLPIHAFTEMRDNSISRWCEGSSTLRKLVLPAKLVAFAPKALEGCSMIVELAVPSSSATLEGDGSVVYSAGKERLLAVAPAFAGHLDIPATVQAVDSCAFDGARPASLRFHTEAPPRMPGSALVQAAYVLCPSPEAYAEIFPEIDCVAEIATVTVEDVTEGKLLGSIGNLGYGRDDVRSVQVQGTLGQKDIDALLALSNLHHADLSACTTTATSLTLPAGKLCEIALPAGSYALHINEGNFLQGRLAIPEGVYYVSGGDNARFSEVVFPSTLTSMGDDSFNESFICRADFSACSYLSAIDAFTDCALLEELLLPPYLESLAGVTRAPLKSIEIPSSVREIQRCSDWDIRSIVLPKALEKLSGFGQMPLLKQVDASACGRLSRVSSSFDDCPKLEFLDLSQSPIDYFGGCNGTSDPASAAAPQSSPVKRLVVSGRTKYPAPGFSGLKSILLPSTISSVSGFDNCVMLTSLDLSHCYRLESLYGLSNCMALDSLALPSQLCRLSIGKGCTSLSKISSAALEPPAITADLAEGALSSVDLYVPSGTAGAYHMAEGWSTCRSIREGGYSVTLRLDPKGLEAPMLMGAGLYEAGKTVQLSAAPFVSYDKLRDWEFDSWQMNGDVEGESAAFYVPEVSFVPQGNCTVAVRYGLGQLQLERADIVLEFEAPTDTTVDLWMGKTAYTDDLVVYSEEGKISYDSNRPKLPLKAGTNRFGVVGHVSTISSYEEGGRIVLKSIVFNDTVSLSDLSIVNLHVQELDVSHCRNLQHLSVQGNELTSLDLSFCTKLATLDCSDNLLYSLSLAPGTPTESISLDNNPAAFSLITPYLYNMLLDQYGETESQMKLGYKLVAENQPEPDLLDLRRELGSQPYGSSTEVDINIVFVWQFTAVSEVERGLYRFSDRGGYILTLSNPQFPLLVYTTACVEFDASGSTGLEGRSEAPAGWKLAVGTDALSVDGLEVGTVAELYTVSGVLVDKAFSTGSTLSLPLPDMGGLYLLRVGNGKISHVFRVPVS